MRGGTEAGTAAALAAVALVAGGPLVEPAPALQEPPGSLTVPAGTRLVAALRDTLGTGRGQEGGVFAADVVRPVRVPGGVAVPRGATVHLTAVRLRPSRNVTEPTVVRLRFDSLTVRGRSRPVRATLLTRRGSTRSSRTGLLVSVLWIVLGAAAGGIAGKRLSEAGGGVLTGAALGAVAVAVLVMVTQDVDSVLPAGAEIELRLEEDVEVPAPR